MKSRECTSSNYKFNTIFTFYFKEYIFTSIEKQFGVQEKLIIFFMFSLGIFSAWNNTFMPDGLAVYPELYFELEGKISENLPSSPQKILS